jgi:hypothetical protein
VPRSRARNWFSILTALSAICVSLRGCAASSAGDTDFQDKPAGLSEVGPVYAPSALWKYGCDQLKSWSSLHAPRLFGGHAPGGAARAAVELTPDAWPGSAVRPSAQTGLASSDISPSGGGTYERSCPHPLFRSLAAGRTRELLCSCAPDLENTCSQAVQQSD